MFITVDGKKVFYVQHIGEGIPVLLLHGWGANNRTMEPIFKFLKSINRSVISIDFLGFGESDMPPEHFGIYQFATLVEDFLNQLGICKVVLVGHSFGGRVGIVLASKTTLIKKLVLVDSAGMKPRRKLSYYIRVFKYKRAKRKNKDVSNYGSSDFKLLPSELRMVFTRVVNQHLEKELPRISVQTLIIWGEKDCDTPLYMAKRLNKRIKDSGLVVLKDCGHFSYLEDINRFNCILKEFIKDC